MPGLSSAPVVVIGAGLAGLACAQRLARARIDVLVLEASDGVGGRVRTDVVDGFRCDRGFQLLNPAYPVLPRVVELVQLDLKPFAAGVVVARGGRSWVLADPRRELRQMIETLRAPLGSLADKVRFARWAARSLLPVRHLLSRDDRTLAEDLTRSAVAGPLRGGVVEPFLAGVLADWQGTTSARLAALLVRSFILGSPSVPALGMQRFPELIAATLPAGTVHLQTPVRAADRSGVRTDDGEVRARAVVVATDPTNAAALTGLPAPRMKGLTTFWHTAPESPSRRRFLHLDADRTGPLANSVVLTTGAPSYGPAGRPLIASTTVGADDSTEAERAARAHAGRIYGVDPNDWELVTVHAVRNALPAQPPPLVVRQPVTLAKGFYVAGDHRDTASIQGALVSGRRAASAVLAELQGRSSAPGARAG